MALIKCSECGHEVSDKASACPNCGCPIEKGLICNECGNSVSPSDKSCPKCGNPIKSKNGFNWKKPILFLVILLFGLGGTYGVWYLIEGNGEQGGDVEITAELSEAVHRYDAVSNFHEGLSAVCKNQKWSYINSKGDEVIPCKYGTADYFSEGLARVRNEDDKFGFIDKKGELVIPCKYDFADCFSEGLARVGNEDNKYGFIDKKGELVIPCKYDFEAESFSEGLARVRNEDGKYGFIDKKGELVIPCKYDYAENFSEGLALVRNEDDKFGFIDKKGELVIPYKYDYAENFSEGLAVAYLLCGDNVIYGYVDKKGNSTFTNEDFAELEKYEAGKAEQKRQEEERKRREGVEKIVSITVEREDNHGRFVDVNGNYGAKVYSGMWHYGEYAITNLIKIPNGKVWIFKKVKLVKGSLWGLYLFYYAKEYGHSGVDYFDKEYNLPEGNPPVLREGDAFRIAARSICKGITTVEVYFSEKDEEYYY